MTEESDLSRVWRTFIARHFAFEPKKLSVLPTHEIDKKIERWQKERMFLYRMDIDYSFDRLINDKTKELGWIDSHIEQLTFLILLDLVQDGHATLKDIEAFWQKRRKAGYEYDGRAAPNLMTERNTRRLFCDYYPEVFIFPDAKAEDGRCTLITSIFSTQEDPLKDESTGLYQYLLKIESVAHAALFGGPQQADQFYQNMRIHSSMLRLADPLLVERIVKYRDIVKPFYHELTRRFGHTFERKSIFKEGEPLDDHQIIALYAFVRTAVLLRWFRSLQPKRQEKVLYDEKKILYSKEEAIRAIAANRKWCSDDYHVILILTNGAIAYSDALCSYETSAVILETLIEEIDMDEVCLASALHNLGSIYSHIKKPKKAIGMYNLSKEIWEGLGLRMNVAIMLASISELYALESKLDQSRKAFQDALNLIDGTPDSIEKVMVLLSLVRCIDVAEDEQQALKVLEEGMRITGQDPEIPPKYNTIFFQNWLYKTIGSPCRLEYYVSGIPDIARNIKFIETPYSSYIPIPDDPFFRPESVERAAEIRAKYFPKKGKLSEGGGI